MLEFANQDSLDNIISTNKHLPLLITFCIFYQVVQTVKFIHSNDIVHIDLKNGNILINNGLIKLIDFGGSILNCAADSSKNQYLSTVNNEAESANSKLHEHNQQLEINYQKLASNCTPLYLSPEFICRSIRMQSMASIFIWSVGIVLFELLHGYNPWSNK